MNQQYTIYRNYKSMQSQNVHSHIYHESLNKQSYKASATSHKNVTAFQKTFNRRERIRFHVSMMKSEK